MSVSAIPSGYEAFSTFNPQQQQAFTQLMQMLQGGGSPLFQSGQNVLQRYLTGGPEAYEQFKAPLMRQYREQIIPGIAERFGGMGAQKSSAFQQALSGSAADLTERLGSLRGQLQMQALPQALQYEQAPIQNILQMLGINTQGLVPKQPPWWQQALTGLAGGVGQGIGAGLTGGIGGIGSALGGMLGGRY